MRVYTIVWEKFDVKNFIAGVTRRKLNARNIFLTINKKVTFLFIGDFHTKISNSEFFPNYGMVLTDDNYNSSIDRYQNLREMEPKLIQPLLVAIHILNLASNYN